MIIDVALIPSEIDTSSPMLEGKTVVVIDVLRATTTIVTALSNGCERVIGVETLKKAKSLSLELDKPFLLCGERKGSPPIGFDLGNSPIEYSVERIRGKTVILTTTNGTKALASACKGEKVICAAFVNVSAVVKEITKIGSDTLFLCSGREGRFSMEDTLCAGMMIDKLNKEKEQLSDVAKAVQLLYKNMNGSLVNLLKDTEHGSYLQSIGYEDDIYLSSMVDEYDIVPILTDIKKGGYCLVSKKETNSI